MKLTVGSLPSAVYWRRRAIVLVTALFGLSVVWVSCSGPDKTKKVDMTRQTASVQATPGASSSSPAVVLGPTISASGSAIPAETVPDGATSAAPVVADGPAVCADNELLITPVPESVTAPRGQPMRLTIMIKNISNRSCPRDLGPTPQELYILQNTTKMYTSDACDTRTGSQVRTLAAGSVQAFYVSWDGKATSGGCSGRQAPAAGKYQLVGRLGSKISDPVVLTLT
jgi:hypothetical protein